MSVSKIQYRLGLVGYGEIGSTLGAGLRGAGLETIASYDKYAFDGPYADLIQSRAKEAGVTLVRSNQELADAADLIISVTPGSASLESADAFAPCLTSRHTFADFASALGMTWPRDDRNGPPCHQAIKHIPSWISDLDQSDSVGWSRRSASSRSIGRPTTFDHEPETTVI